MKSEKMDETIKFTQIEIKMDKTNKLINEELQQQEYAKNKIKK
jgi:hypothetical protein